MGYCDGMEDRYKHAIRRHYRGVCQYCGAGGANHIDHIIALSKGGADDLTNLTLACRWCNVRKHDIDLDPMFLAIAHARAKAAAPRIAAKAKGPGRRSKLSAEQAAQAAKMYENIYVTAEEVGRTFGVSRATVYRAVQKSQEAKEAQKFKQAARRMKKAARAVADE